MQMQPDESNRFSVLGARVTWMALGPMVAMLAAVGIISHGRGWVTYVDAIFAVAVALTLFGRWFEMRFGNAMTASGEPATWGHFRRYVMALIPVAAAAWVAANVLGNHVFASDA